MGTVAGANRRERHCPQLVNEGLSDEKWRNRRELTKLKENKSNVCRFEVRRAVLWKPAHSGLPGMVPAPVNERWATCL